LADGISQLVPEGKRDPRREERKSTWQQRRGQERLGLAEITNTERILENANAMRADAHADGASSAVDALRVPPHNLEAERGIIGGILISNELLEPVAEIVDGDDFYAERHRTIWTAICSLASARRPIDAITLGDALGPRMPEIGSAYIAECAATGLPALTVDYARIVREKAIQRDLAAFGKETATRALDAPPQWSPEWTEERLAVAEYELARIASRAIRKPEPKKAETLANLLWQIEHRVQNAVPTGFAIIDEAFGGFDVGHLTILGGRTSRGKTALATNFAINAPKAGFATAYFTLEMTHEEMWLRAIGCEAQVDMFGARRFGYRRGEKQKVEKAFETLRTLPLEIRYRPFMTPCEFRLECRRLTRDMGVLKLAIIDYLGLMRGDRHERERWREMQEVVLALKGIAGELGISILVTAQLNREGGEDAQPSPANLRDTGATEEHASNVLLIWQPPAEKQVPAPSHNNWEDVEVIIAKQRNGPPGLRVAMQFSKQWGVFRPPA
jgi:replicative DNA helicase